MTRPPDLVHDASRPPDTAVPGPVAALGAAVHDAKGLDPLAPLTVVAPSAYAALAARRALGSSPGPGGRRGSPTSVSRPWTSWCARSPAPCWVAGAWPRARSSARPPAPWRCRGEGGWPSFVGHPRGLAALVDALAELRRCPAGTLGLSPRRRGRVGDLARLLDEVRAQLHEQGYVDAVDVAEAAASVAETGNVAGLGPVLVFDPGSIAASDRRILDVVVARTGLTGPCPAPERLR